MAEKAQKAKPAWRSKTLWVNVLTVAGQFTGVIPIPAPALPYVLAGINIGLRFLTKGPVGFTPDDAPTPKPKST